jgi:hypothetical protein
MMGLRSEKATELFEQLCEPAQTIAKSTAIEVDIGKPKQLVALDLQEQERVLRAQQHGTPTKPGKLQSIGDIVRYCHLRSCRPTGFALALCTFEPIQEFVGISVAMPLFDEALRKYSPSQGAPAFVTLASDFSSVIYQLAERVHVLEAPQLVRSDQGSIAQLNKLVNGGSFKSCAP